MSKRPTPITESSNELTRDLDISSPLEMARLMRQSDEQMFSGYRGFPGLLDDEIVGKMARLVGEAASAVEAGEHGAIFLSGAGTSGRFAQLLSRQFNRILRNAHLAPVFRPLVAGGALALVKAQEGAEDDPATAARDLENALPEEPKKVLYVGVTCGLSAPYTAGQLDYLHEKPWASSVLMSFNAIEMARDVPIEGWDKTFAEVMETCLTSDRFVLLNPIHGPETVMGSTRMKGGSITKIILECIFTVALELLGALPPEEGVKPPARDDLAAIEKRIRQLLRRYRETMHAVYEQIGVLEGLIRLGGTTLRSGGRVSYLGRESAGIVALIDASECPPTFGASFEDIRGHLAGGWHSLLDSEDRDFSDSGPEFQIDFDAFATKKIPDLAKGDAVLGVAIGEIGPKTRPLLEQVVKTTRATVGVVLVTVVPPKKGDLPVAPENAHILTIPALGFTPGMMNLAEFALKLALNALSTGAHVLIGKVYENRMIDLRISNNKLYFRSLLIIQKLAECTEERARLALHRAVYRKDVLSAEELAAAPSTIIAAATDVSRIVPTALLLAMGDMTHEQASELLAADPVPRRVIKAQIDKKK
ncbi:MAG: hypothetical protein PWP23_458 [Candidatus Sumerlaeota bacterium]|nr:hypothetical protein [Candidatus Sumerlaeota bacterium]